MAIKYALNYSINFDLRKRRSKEIRFVIFHYTGMKNENDAINRLKNFNHKVSTHFFIKYNGKIICMVPEKYIAWHAGKSKWKNFINLNKNSIGIEIVNKGHELGYEKFTFPQINSLIKICKNLKKKYKIKNSNIVGHSDIAPLRKKDPGEKFPWEKLHNKKLGIWFKNLKYKPKKLQDKKIKKLFFKNLFKIGYRYFKKNKRSSKDIFIIKAFQRRFLQRRVSGIIDEKTYIISHFLANRFNN